MQATTKIENSGLCTHLTVAKNNLNMAMTTFKQHPSNAHYEELLEAMLKYQNVYFEDNN